LGGPGYGRNNSQLKKYSFVPMPSRGKWSLGKALGFQAQIDDLDLKGEESMD